jgi:hypothetical protein
MIGLHEGEVAFVDNEIRGAQFYPNCVQIEVTGDGSVELPEGVSFPGAYQYDTPGIVYDVHDLSPNTLSEKLIILRSIAQPKRKQRRLVPLPHIPSLAHQSGLVLGQKRHQLLLDPSQEGQVCLRGK